nr:MAG TPA: hypothetical protein [Caudoviricetes sp.]
MPGIARFACLLPPIARKIMIIYKLRKVGRSTWKGAFFTPKSRKEAKG